MRIEQLMTRDVRTCEPGDALSVAAQRMWESDCGVLPVVDAKGAVIGMITDRDVCMAAYTKGLRLSDLKVEGAMARRVVSCRPDEDLASAERTMQNHQVRRLPVLDREGRLAGILSINDLAREAVRAGRSRNVSREEVARTLGAICHPWGTPREEALVAPAPETAAAYAGAAAR